VLESKPLQMRAGVVWLRQYESRTLWMRHRLFMQPQLQVRKWLCVLGTEGLNARH
jgi:hypothetical protein